jgi:hypothetical protein
MMTTVLGIVILAAPFVALVALVWLRDRRLARRHREIARQIALTDALHARLGAVVAPVVRRRQHGWHVAVAVPVERAGVVATVLSAADEVFGPGGYEIALSRQPAAAPAAGARRAAALAMGSLSWN